MEVSATQAYAFGYAYGPDLTHADGYGTQQAELPGGVPVEATAGPYGEMSATMHASNDAADSLPPGDKLTVSSGNEDGRHDGSGFVPSAVSMFVHEYKAQHPDASIEEVQQQYDRAYAKQSDYHLTRQGVLDADDPLAATTTNPALSDTPTLEPGFLRERADGDPLQSAFDAPPSPSENNAAMGEATAIATEPIAEHADISVQPDQSAPEFQAQPVGQFSGLGNPVWIGMPPSARHGRTADNFHHTQGRSHAHGLSSGSSVQGEWQSPSFGQTEIGNMNAGAEIPDSTNIVDQAALGLTSESVTAGGGGADDAAHEQLLNAFGNQIGSSLVSANWDGNGQQTANADVPTGVSNLGLPALADQIARLSGVDNSTDPFPPLSPQLPEYELLAGDGSLVPKPDTNGGVPIANLLHQGDRVAALTREGYTLVGIHLPGLGDTYVDPRMSTALTKWMELTSDQGVDIHFNSAFRLSGAEVSGVIYTPAGDTSLHNAGLAVDVRFDKLRDISDGLTGNQQRDILRTAAAEAGLSWGGSFGDRVHFFIDPYGAPGPNRAALIRTQQDAYQLLNKR